MNRIVNYFFRFCPKTGKFKGIRQIKGFSRLLFPFIGLIALIWILIRVIPKPSRLNYPCVKTAMPFAAGFIVNFILFFVSAWAFIRLKKSYFRYQYIVAGLFITISIGGTFYFDNANDAPVYPTLKIESNLPMGEAKGIFPGRVVWVYDADATNKNCDPNTAGDGWFLPKNNDQKVIDAMVSSALRNITGKSTDKDAWDAVFAYYNKNKGKGEVNYNTSEKIFIKINATSSWSGNFSTQNLSKTNNQYYGVSETSPQIILSVFRQLVNVVGVPQDKIYIGDPMKHIYKHCYDMWHAEFPNIHYLDNGNYSNLGREKAATSNTAKIFFSDRGKILRTNVWSNNDPGVDTVFSDNLYKIFEDAEYVLNIPMLKGHKRAGITAFAKNHFGSQTRGDASHLHNGLVAPTELPNVSRGGYGLYRVQVDLMGDKLLSGKNLLYLMDALWSADQEISYPKKFTMQPFNNDWSSSIFASLDPVAIESVGYDFLQAEFTAERNVGDGAGTYIQMPGADDYLRQAADSANWPAGIRYDPENDGTVIPSLGVYEHWNNSIDKQYTRNLGTGNGIELLKADAVTSVEDNYSNIVKDFKLYQNYPNPFNPSTSIRYTLNVQSFVILKIYDTEGKEVSTLVNEQKQAGEYEVSFNMKSFSSGVYYYKITAGSHSLVRKMILMK